MRVKEKIFLMFIFAGTVLVVLLLLTQGEDRESSTLTTNSHESVDSRNSHDRVLSTRAEKYDKDATLTEELFGDMWEICGIGEFPSEIENAKKFVFDREFAVSDECKTALETHVSSINPFKEHHLSSFGTGYEFSLFVLENPMTYARIFSDPAGDLERVINALSRSECRLEQERKNWNLKESCNADAFTNYAVFYRVCHGVRGTSQARYYFYNQQEALTKHTSDTNVTVEIWKGFLERVWIDNMCSTFDSELELSTTNLPQVFEQLVSYNIVNHPNARESRERLRSNSPQEAAARDADDLYVSLLTLGARLGDEAAALTWEGKNFGVFLNTFKNANWKSLRELENPSKDKISDVLSLAVALKKDGVNFDWNWLVKSVCGSSSPVESEQSKSCRSLIDSVYVDFASDLGQPSYTVAEARKFLSNAEIEELRDETLQNFSIGKIVSSEDKRQLLLALDRFSEVAMALGVYE